MNELGFGRGRRAIAGALVTGAMVLGAMAATPVAAQGGGGRISSCMLNGGGTIDLGTVPTLKAARDAARARNLASGSYAVAVLGRRRIAIDSAGGIHGINEMPCLGSGPGMQKPE